MTDFPKSLVDAADQAIVLSWSPENEYDDAGRAAAVAVLRAQADYIEKTIVPGPGTIRRWADMLEASGE